MMAKRSAFIITGIFWAILVEAQVQTFTNPLLPSGADPWVMYKDGFYYYTHTRGNQLEIWKTTSIAGLKNAERTTVWTPPDSTPYSQQIWAPELHYIKGKWYMYFAADDGNNNNHRLYVIENASPNPLQGTWIWKGKINDPTDKWAIDGSVFRHRRRHYMVWSGWSGDTNGQQDIYIAKLKNPWTIRGRRVRISSPVYNWEKDGDLNNANDPAHVNVNEGPQILKNGKKLFLIYSASGCWTDSYALGMLTLTGKKLLDSASWHKSSYPVFTGSAKNGVYAPGHNSFFKSPNKKEDWILYHANSEPGQGCGGRRSPRAQPFTWNKDGTPQFGEPIPTGVPLPVPAQ